LYCISVYKLKYISNLIYSKPPPAPSALLPAGKVLTLAENFLLLIYLFTLFLIVAGLFVVLGAFVVAGFSPCCCRWQLHKKLLAFTTNIRP